MADENILEIGALVNLSTFTPSMQAMVTTSRTAAEQMTASFRQLATSTASSTAQMTTAFLSVPPAAQQIPPAIRKVEVESEASTVKIGGAWRGLATTIKEAGASIIGTMSEVGAKMSETAERSRLGVGVMESAFAGLSSLLGAGIAVGFAAHFLDESARVVIELKHLQVETGISIQTLAGLRAVAQQTAVPFDPLALAMIRLQRAQVQAVEGHTAQIRAFADLGVSVNELRGLKPEELFFRLTSAIHDAHSTQVAMSSAITLFGRGIYQALPLMREYGNNLQKMAEEAGKNSGVTDQAAKAAQEWHQMTAELAQTFQSFMIPVLEVAIPVIKAVQTGFEVLATVLITVAEAISTGVVGAFKAMFYEVKSFSKIIQDVMTGNIAKIPADVKEAVGSSAQVFKDGGTEIANNWKALRGELQNIWSKPLSPPEAPAPEGLGDLSAGKGKSTIVQQFREELDEKREAEKGFHELSKNEEAQFWASKLSIVKGNVAAYREVYHEFVNAERAARKESLAEEMGNLQQRLAAERSGSQQRIIILEEELNYLKRIGAMQTADARRVQDMLVTARREASQQDEREYIKSVEGQLAASRKNAQAKIELLNEALFFALNTYTVDSDAYRKLTELKAAAERELADEKREIAAIDASAEKAHQQALLDINKAAIEQRFSLGLISNAQRIALLRDITNKEMALERAALEEKLALYKNEPVERERVLKQIEALEDKHAKLMQQIDQQEAKSRIANWKKFEDEVSNGFAAAVGRWVQTGKGFGQAMAQMWNNMLVQFSQMLARMLAQFILHQLTKVVVAQASEGAQTAAAAAGASARGGIGLLEAIKSIGRAAAVGAAHAFKWVMEEVPFPVNIALAPAVAAATFAGIIGFGALAGGGKAAKGGLLSQDGPIFAHADELILPPKISAGMQDIIAAGSFRPTSALTNNLTTLGSSTHTNTTSVSNHNNHVSVGSPRINVSVNGSDASSLAQLQQRVTEAIKRAVRNGADLGFQGV